MPNTTLLIMTGAAAFLVGALLARAATIPATARLAAADKSIEIAADFQKFNAYATYVGPDNTGAGFFIDFLDPYDANHRIRARVSYDSNTRFVGTAGVASLTAGAHIAVVLNRSAGALSTSLILVSPYL